MSIYSSIQTTEFISNITQNNKLFRQDVTHPGALAEASHHNEYTGTKTPPGSALKENYDDHHHKIYF